MGQASDRFSSSRAGLPGRRKATHATLGRVLLCCPAAVAEKTGEASLRIWRGDQGRPRSPGAVRVALRGMGASSERAGGSSAVLAREPSRAHA